MVLNHREMQLIEDYPLAIVATSSSTMTLSTPMPLILSSCGNYLSGHLARNNPFLKGVGVDAIEIYFTGANGYISPTWSEEQSVPTWNYVYAHISATAEVVDEQETKLNLMREMTEHFESQWSFSDFVNEEKALAKTMLNAITVVRFKVKGVHSKFKLSQRKSGKFKERVIDAIERKGDQELATWMRRESHL